MHEEKIEKRISLHGKDSKNVDYEYSYKITDNDGNVTQATLSKVGMYLTDDAIERGDRNLVEKVGVHCLDYTINGVDGYEIEPITFSIKIEFVESSATKHLKYELSPNSNAMLVMSAEESNTYDIYKVFSVPTFYAFDVETGIHLLDNTAKFNCRKLSENYYWESVQSSFSSGDGIYLCEINHNNDNYYPNIYRFYAIYVEN